MNMSTSIIAVILSLFSLIGAEQTIINRANANAREGNFAIPLASNYSVPPNAITLQRYIDATSRVLDKRMQRALLGIDDMPKRLLALKYYIRRRGSINANWAWGRAETDRYKHSTTYRRSMLAIAAIKAKFAELNPGYNLTVNTNVRPLGDQIRSWNTTGVVAGSGADLFNRAQQALADTTTWPQTPTKASLSRFQKFLAAHNVLYTPTVAVPGFSQHGQLRAFDFVVRQGDNIIASTDAGSVAGVWDNPGWTTKLKEAITAVSDRFDGPLKSPYEPWHYNYTH